MTEHDSPRQRTVNLLARAIGDPGSVLPRREDETVTRWAARAAEALLHFGEAHYGISPEVTDPEPPVIVRTDSRGRVALRQILGDEPVAMYRAEVLPGGTITLIPGRWVDGPAA